MSDPVHGKQITSKIEGIIIDVDPDSKIVYVLASNLDWIMNVGGTPKSN
jgi:hypothetical protein